MIKTFLLQTSEMAKIPKSSNFLMLIKFLRGNLNTLKIEIIFQGITILFPHIFEHPALPVNAVISHNVSLSGKSPG